MAVQRYILIFVLVLIFEIIDLKYDDPHLKTVPQQIGVSRTKKLGLMLLMGFIGLEFCFEDFNFPALILKLGIAATVALFLWFADEKKSKYYSSFWAESIPILWWLLLLFLSQCYE